MPRSLWLVALACATAVLVALWSLRDERALAVPDPDAIQAISSEPSDEVTLASAPSAEPAERAPITSPAEKVREPRAPAPRIGGYDIVTHHVGTGNPQPAFVGLVTVRVVREEDGLALPDAEVLLEFPDSWNPERLDQRTARTDSGGTATFDGVAEWRSKVTVTVPGRALAIGWANLDERNSSTTVEIRLSIRREFVVRLLDGLGRPFRAEDWHLSREHAALLGIGVSGACGNVGQSFEARDAPLHTARSTERELGPFTWRVELRGAGDVCVHALLGSTTLGATEVPPDATEIAIRIDNAALDAAHAPVVVRVLDDADGTPIVGAEVEFRGSGPQPIVLTTETDGRARADLVPSVNLVAVARAAGRAPVSVAIERSDRSEIVLRLPVGRRIEGRVVDESGNPVENARVELKWNVPSELLPKASRTKSRADGTFTLTGLPPLQYEVLVYRRNERRSANADCSDADVLGIVLQVGG